MKKRFGLSVLFGVLLASTQLFAQCNLGVGIDSNPIGNVCKDVSVVYTAQPTGNPINPKYIWVIGGDTIGTDSTITLKDFTTVNLQVYMSSSSCSVPDTFFTNSIYHQVPSYTADYKVLITECNQTKADVQINDVLGVFATPPYTYNLITGEGSLGQREIYLDLPVATYPLYIEDAQGCGDTIEVDMSVVRCPPPSPLEVITPNGDGYNDAWIIANIEYYPNNEVFVFDRWGQRVYHKKGYDNVTGWDVKYLAVDLPVSTYYYILKVNLEKGDDFILKGAISIFR